MKAKAYKKVKAGTSGAMGVSLDNKKNSGVVF